MSTDMGSTWAAINSGLSGGGLIVASLISHGESVYAGTAAGAWKRSLSEVIILQASPATLSIDAESNSTATFNITSNVNWTLSNTESWLTLSTTNGTGNATITATAQKNPTTNTRNATITVQGTGAENQSVVVTQKGSTTGIEESEQDGVSIYPNPVSATLRIEGIGDDSKVHIYNINGMLVLSIEKPENLIDISDLPSGAYFIRVKDKSRFVTKKFVKQ